MGAERTAAEHMKVIDRCIKRRHGRRPADVVDRIEVTDQDAADRLYDRMKSQGYGRIDKTPATRHPVTLDVPDFFLTLATALAADQGISREAFMAQILTEGLHEAFLEFNHQRRAGAGNQAAATAPLSNDLDDDIPF